MSVKVLVRINLKRTRHIFATEFIAKKFHPITYNSIIGKSGDNPKYTCPAVSKRLSFINPC